MTVDVAAVDGASPSLSQRVHRWARPLALVAAAIGLIALAGWVLGVEELRQIGSLPEMRVAAAVAVVVTGGALVLLDRPGRRSRVIGGILLAGVALTAIATVVAHLTDTGLGALDTPRSPHAALTLFALSIWIATMDATTRSPRVVSQVAAVATALGVTSLLIGYAYDVGYLTDNASDGAVSPQGVVAVTLLALAAAASRPATGFAAPMLTEDTAGTALRRMLPVAFAVPLVCGFLFVRGERADAFGVAEGVLLVVVLGVLLFAIAVISTTRELARAEAERTRLEKRLEELAERDPLTDLFNRRRLIEEYGQLLARAARTEGSFALVILDVDNLKPINDRLGHAAGDQVLISVARALREGVRTTDAVARTGGDEFAILLADVGDEEARSIVEILLRQISRPQVLYEKRVGGDPVFITASAGIAIGGPGDGGLDELMHEADQALYEAKASGRSELRVAAARSSGSDRPRAGTVAAFPGRR